MGRIIMNYESGVSDITRDVQLRIKAGGSASQPRSDTSSRSGNSTRESVTTQYSDSFNGGTRAFTENSLDPIDLHKAVEKLNKFIRSQQRDVSFSVDEEAKATVIKIFKTETGELIKQFPPDEILAMIAKLRKTIGWLVDRKA